MGKDRDIKPGNGLLDWGTRGRPLQHGPIWGHHCGLAWKSARPPTDSLDEACQRHDACWESCKEESKQTRWQRMRDGRLHERPSKRKECREGCDDAMVEELKDLPKDPTKWPDPVPKRSARAARRYLEAARRLFEWF